MPKRRTFIFFFWVGPAHKLSPGLRQFVKWFYIFIVIICFCYFLLGIDAEFVSMHVEVTDQRSYTVTVSLQMYGLSNCLSINGGSLWDPRAR